MALGVTGMILSAAAAMALVFASHNDEGSAAVKLATHGRFALATLGRDVRAARAAGVSSSRALTLWMGDADDNGKMNISEFVIYAPAAGGELHRLAFTGPAMNADIGSDGLTSVMNWHANGQLNSMVEGNGGNVSSEAICRNISFVRFVPNRQVPETLSIEIALKLARAQNIETETGRTVSLTFFNTATMRAPSKEGGLDPKN